MRLTNKKKVECANKSIELNGKDIVNDSTLIYAKLGQLEDIEEELGIDLIILLKLLNSGCYVIDKWGKDDKEIISHFSFANLKEDGFYAKYEDYCDEHFFYFKDYGKTWALTREELL